MHYLEVVFLIKGRIPSKKNSRLTLPGGKTIPSKDYLEWQERARWIVRQSWVGSPVKTPVEVEITTTCRNDADNLAASILDMLEGLIYANDSQVKKLVVKKAGGGKPYKTEVRVLIKEG